MRGVHGERILQEITKPLQSSNSIYRGKVPGVDKTATMKNSSKQSKNESRRTGNKGQENIPPSDLDVLNPKSPSLNESIQKYDLKNVSDVSSGPDVQVCVRIRPLNALEESRDRSVQKVSSDSMSIGDKTFRFDSVFDSDSTQEDVFRKVGVPLVKNSMAGFNTTLLLYGQTGSGKTYTIWGPQSAIISDGIGNSVHRGVAPRIFDLLFSEIQKEKDNCVDKQMHYQCRCSFLEIHNEQIDDLLDSTKRNLQIKEDVRNGLYVENLTEECITNMDDVNYLLIKGLSNRRTGATSLNSKSSPSHIILTCCVQSWCKETSSTCLSSSKLSRINLIDLAGSGKEKLDESGYQFRNVKQSLSHLGNLINIVAEATESKEARSIPYRSSCLTHLLQDSIGGNAKLTILCTVSPSQRCYSDTLSTLRFGRRARAMQNKATMNEITEEDVSNLSDQICQLKEELIKLKSNTNGSTSDSYKCFREWDTRKSLTKLRLSLTHSMLFSQIDFVRDEEKIPSEDLEELCTQLHTLCSSIENDTHDAVSSSGCAVSRFSLQTDNGTNMRSLQVHSSDPVESSTSPSKFDCIDEAEKNNVEKDSGPTNGSIEVTVTYDTSQLESGRISEITGKDPTHETSSVFLSSSLKIVPPQVSHVLLDPSESTSPRIDDRHRKGLMRRSKVSKDTRCLSHSHVHSKEVPKVCESESLRKNGANASLRSSKMLSSPSDYLAASLQRGLQIIDNHEQPSITRKSSSFSLMKLSPEPFQQVDSVDTEVQTPPMPTLSGSLTSFICMSCKKMNKVSMGPQKSAEIDDGSSSAKEMGDVARAPDSETLLANICSEQAARIKELDLLVQKYERERAQYLQDSHIQKEKTQNLEGMVDNKLELNEESEIGKCPALADECGSLKDKYDDDQEMIKAKAEQLQDLRLDLDSKCKSSHELTDREPLLKEIEKLRNHLKLYMENPKFLPNRSSMSQSTKLMENNYCEATEDVPSSDEDKAFELERQRWLESESEWISLTEGLRVDLEANRRLAERKELELNLEKQCSNELSDALQRAIYGHARIVEQYADLQDNYTNLLSRHKKIMEGIEDVKRAAAKAGKRGSIFVESLAAELSVLRFDRDKERDQLRKENRKLRLQQRDTAEAVQAAGELLVRLKEAEAAAASAEARYDGVKQEAELLKRKIEKLEKKHAKELALIKTQLASSRLPESALEPLYRHQSDQAVSGRQEEWRHEFMPFYKDASDPFSTDSNQTVSQNNVKNVLWDKWNESHI